MKYTITSERALKLIKAILAPFEIRNKIDDSWKGNWWKLSNGAPQRQVIVWDESGQAVFTYDRMYNELAISKKHFDKILSYIPLSSEELEELLIKLFKGLLDDKFPVERLQNFDISWNDKKFFDDDDEDEN